MSLLFCRRTVRRRRDHRRRLAVTYEHERRFWVDSFETVAVTVISAWTAILNMIRAITPLSTVDSLFRMDRVDPGSLFPAVSNDFTVQAVILGEPVGPRIRLRVIRVDVERNVRIAI